MRLLACIAACVLGLPAWANPAWRVVLETEAESVAVEVGSLQRDKEQVGFRERRTVRGMQTNANSLRPVREVLSRRLADCRAQRIATLSRAVFSDDDALIEHRAVRLNQAEWQPVAKDDPVFRLVCGRS